MDYSSITLIQYTKSQSIFIFLLYLHPHNQEDFLILNIRAHFFTTLCFQSNNQTVFIFLLYLHPHNQEDFLILNFRAPFFTKPYAFSPTSRQELQNVGVVPLFQLLIRPPYPWPWSQNV